MVCSRAVILVSLLSLSLVACGRDQGGMLSRVKVVSAIYPLEFVARQVAGNRATVSDITPPGVEPHDIELTAAQVRDVTGADLVLYLGGGFQPAVEALLEQVKGRTVNVLDLTPGGGRTGDPHVWLDPFLMAGITGAVSAALEQIDRPNASFYRTNAEGLIAQLNALGARFRNQLSVCDRRDIVTSHDAFGYLAERFNLRQTAIAGVDPQQEPSAQRLREVAALVRQKGATTIFFESLLPRDIAETVARETGTRTDKLDPIESRPAKGDYRGAMLQNLEALRVALNCR